MGIVSYQFKGLAFILNVTTGISVEMGTILGALLIIFLAFAGGLVTVAVTDAISAFLMLFGLMIAVPAVINAAGGWNKIVANVPPQNLTFFGSLTPLQLIGYYLPLLFLLLGDQNMYQRLAASKGTKEAKIGMKGWFIGLLILSPGVAVIAAFAARALFPKINPGIALISTTLVTPTFVEGILLAAAAAFIVTTGNS